MKQGPSTLVVSIPSALVKRFKVKKGDSVFLKDQEKGFAVSFHPQNDEKKIAVDLSGTLPMTHRIVGALYKAGYDEMTLKYSTAEEAKAILETIPRLQGHEVFQHQKNAIVVKGIVKMDQESFDILYRKCFHVVKDMAEDTVIALKKNDKELMQQVILKDDMMAVFVDYTRRMLLKGIVSEQSTELYYIATQLEKIADRLKYVCRYYASPSSSSHVKQKPTQAIVVFLEEVTKYFQLFETLFYSFSLEKVAHFGKERKRLLKRQEELFPSVPRQEMRAFTELTAMLSLIFDLNGSLLEMKLAHS